MQMTIDPSRVFTDAIAYLLVLLLAVAGTATAQQSDRTSEDPADLEFFAAGPKKHRKPQDPPIKLGTSGGNANDFFDSDIPPPCSSGTLGALVQNGSQYILSSNRTLAILNDGKKGDPVIQPGLVDTKEGTCNPDNPGGHIVADLTKYKKIKFGGIKKNKVDAALAEVREGMVNPNGRVIGVGIPGSGVVGPFVGQEVKKSGAGTGVKRGTVVAVNVIGDVGYGRPHGAPPIARFVKQFIVESNTNKDILTGRDAGSVFFENTKTCPGWVGLGGPFSEDGKFALVSKMSTVLKQLRKRQPKGPFEPVGCENGTAAVGEKQSPQMRHAMRDAERIQRRVQREVMWLPGVVGIGIGVAKDNPEEVVFKVLVEDDTEAIRANIPEWLGKVRCEVLKTGRFSAM